MGEMKKREKPQRRKRAKTRPRLLHMKRIPCARIHRLQPEPYRMPRFIVEVRVTRTRRQMRDQIRRWWRTEDPRTMGCVVHYFGRARRRHLICSDGRVVAFMFLNHDDLRNYPAEIPSHECVHAAMVWARMRGADLSVMEGEEVLCHAAGRMTQQLANTLFGKVV